MNNLDDRISTGIRNLDEVLNGGMPGGSLIVVAGTPGAGKTILTQQIVFHNASPHAKALIFQTLSEPTAKTLRYLRQFSYFDSSLLEDDSVQFVDLGDILRSQGLEQAVTLLREHVKRVNPAFVIMDSFKVFEDLARSKEELRKFSYEVAIHLMAWECTTFLVGEFNQQDIESNPLFSIADGMLRLSVREESGEQQRFMQLIKLRGRNHSRDEHPFSITSSGIELYAPRVTIRRDPSAKRQTGTSGATRARIGISGLDDLLGEGIPYGSSLLVAGVAGTGKTLLSLEFIYRGAREYGEKSVFVSFEESREHLITTARGMGWDLEGEIESGRIELICIPQTEILVEKHLLQIHECIERLGARRIAIDSISLFLYKVQDERIAREKLFQLTTLVQNAGAIAFFTADIPYGSGRISRFGVEETTVDGVILLTASEEELERARYIEVYKLRITAHRSGRHKLEIGQDGIKVEPGSTNGKRKSGKEPRRQ